MTTALVWFRRDLRLADNPALTRALQIADRIVPVYIHAPEEDGDWTPGAASRWWLHHSLVALQQSLAARGAHLVVRRGPSLAALKLLVEETGARQVCWNRLYEAVALSRDRAIEAELPTAGVEVETANASLLFEPWEITKDDGTSYRVYTPFARRCRRLFNMTAPSPAPARFAPFTHQLSSLPIASLNLLPEVRWDAGLAAKWQPGEAGALSRLQALAILLPDYARQRDLPAASGTTHLSPHLHFGELSPRQVWRAIELAGNDGGAGSLHGAETLERELLWREFAHHVLHYFPHTPGQPLDARFSAFPWRRSKALLTAWQRGRTGIPIVDAGMRELWSTGFMHNRVRMIVASFLTKHAGLDWRAGSRWFWDTLVDADLASNTLNWQWVAGCGADAAPYFRIFNPVLQSRKFDAEGIYLRRWLPELAALPDRYLHEPWRTPATVQENTNLRLGLDYPWPVLDLTSARDAALARYRDRRVRSGSAASARPGAGRGKTARPRTARGSAAGSGG
jgi:deoxyribodipyrimidine photo-lyase